MLLISEGLGWVSTELVPVWFLPRAKESDGMKEWWKAEPFAIEHVQAHPPAGTDCPGKSEATEVSECLWHCKQIKYYWFVPRQHILNDVRMQLPLCSWQTALDITTVSICGTHEWSEESKGLLRHTSTRSHWLSTATTSLSILVNVSPHKISSWLDVHSC